MTEEERATEITDKVRKRLKCRSQRLQTEKELPSDYLEFDGSIVLRVKGVE